MAYLTDKEKRILFSALSREKKVCKQVDKDCCREPYEETLQSVVESLERKFYYDRMEKEIRNATITEFAERIANKDNIVRFDIDEIMSNGNFDYNCDCLRRYIDEIVEEMRGAEWVD